MTEVKTSEQYQAEIHTLSASLKAEQDAHAQTKEALSKESSDHLETMSVNESLQNKIEEQDSIIKNIAAGKKANANVAISKPKVPADSFKVEGETFVFTLPVFIFKGNKILASEALANEDLLKELVKIKFGGIKRSEA